MERIIEHLGLLKIDLKDAVATKVIENSNLTSIVDECEDKLRVNLLKECIEDNEDIIFESKETLKEVNFVISLLEEKINIKKRP